MKNKVNENDKTIEKFNYVDSSMILNNSSAINTPKNSKSILLNEI